MMRIVYAMFPDLEFLHLRKAADKAYPEKHAQISAIARHYIHNTRSDIGYARREFSALGGEAQ